MQKGDFRPLFYCSICRLFSRAEEALLIEEVASDAGDSNNSNEKYYCETYPYVDCDVLKVAHHGSRTSSSEEFLKHVKCEYAVISVGDGNSYGHPEQEALDRLKANGIQKIHRTDKCGNVVLTVSHTGEMAFSCEKQCAA